MGPASGVNGYGIPTGVVSPAPITGALNGRFSTDQDHRLQRLSGGGRSTWVTAARKAQSTSWTMSPILHGQHAFKFGVEYMRQIQDNEQYNTGNGVVSFSSLQNFLKGTVKNGSIAISNEDDRVRLNQFAGFIQDDWRVTKNTLP